MMIFTVIAVNLDAYVAGISLGRTVGTPALLYISLYSFLLPFVGMAVFSVVSAGADGLNLLCACILIILGVRGLLPEDRADAKLLVGSVRRMSVAELTVLGLSLSADNALAAITYSAEPCALALPLLMFAAQYCLLSAGRLTAGLLGFTRILSGAAGGALILLGIMRLI